MRYGGVGTGDPDAAAEGDAVGATGVAVALIDGTGVAASTVGDPLAVEGSGASSQEAQVATASKGSASRRTILRGPSPCNDFRDNDANDASLLLRPSHHLPRTRAPVGPDRLAANAGIAGPGPELGLQHTTRRH
jgi:hypothetical protein